MAKAKKNKLKLSGEALAFFQSVGSKGGKSRAKKHSAAQLSRWAKLGGRPPGSKKKKPEPESEAAVA